jgi:hypothetical protein
MSPSHPIYTFYDPPYLFSSKHNTLDSANEKQLARSSKPAQKVYIWTITNMTDLTEANRKYFE